MFRVEVRESAACAKNSARIFGIEANAGIAAGCEWCLWRWLGVGRSDLLATLQGASCRRFAALAASAAWRGIGSDSSDAAFSTCLRGGWSTGRGDSKSCGTDPGGLLDACVRVFAGELLQDLCRGHAAGVRADSDSGRLRVTSSKRPQLSARHSTGRPRGGSTESWGV